MRVKEAKLAKILTVALVLTMAAIGVRSMRGRQKAESEPQATVYAMLDAARKGDITAYMACFTGPMSASLRQTLAESTNPAFEAYLRESVADLKGIAVDDPESTTTREVRARVEYIYPDRNEAQMVYFENTSGAWKIARMDGDHRVKTLIPYGTPVR